jgi:hypothetical protein
MFLVLPSILLLVTSATADVALKFHAPVLVHKSYNMQHAWFSELSTTSPRATNNLLLTFSLGGDGTTCPPPGKLPSFQNCSMTQLSRDGGISWSPLEHWGTQSFNTLVPLENKSFVSISYGTKKADPQNRTAIQRGWIGHLNLNSSTNESANLIIDDAFTITYTNNLSKFPDVLVHSGCVVQTSSSSSTNEIEYVTTLYGHGVGQYHTKYSTRPAIYIARSNNLKDWNVISELPWLDVYGSVSDGPAEPSTTTLSDGRLLLVFRADSMKPYWKSLSSDNGNTWSTPTQMVSPDNTNGQSGQWSVKPRVRLVPNTDIILLLGGRPGLYLWHSDDFGETWQGKNIASIHNELVQSAELQYTAEVVEVMNWTNHRANPPATSSYFGIVFNANGDAVISYDRLSNGWNGGTPNGTWGAFDAIFTMRISMQSSNSIQNNNSMQSSISSISSISKGTHMGGFLGPYHPTNANVPDGTNRTVFDVFHFGLSAIENAASEQVNWLLADDLNFHCYEHDVNQIFGIILPPSEQSSVINNPNDTSLLIPAHPAGLVQGAARFSKLAQRCPQLTGVVIDDFLQNYAGNTTNNSNCVSCPQQSHPYPYGNKRGGEFCCPWKIVKGHCLKPSDSSAKECCIRPGSLLKCQGYPRCGVNPNNTSACNLPVGNKQITLEDVIQVKGALLGKDIDALTGKVDLSSKSKTPWLRLFVVWYTRFTEVYEEDGLLSGSIQDDEINVPIVDGVSLWIEGTQQQDLYLNWTEQVLLYRNVTNAARPSHLNLPNISTFGGSYIEHSCCGFFPPTPFWSMFNQSLDLYDNGNLDGFFVFAGSSIPKLNTSMWNKWDLEATLNKLYYPMLGKACGIISKPFENVRIVVTRMTREHGMQFVTSKYAKNDGTYCFDGWAGSSTAHIDEAQQPFLVAVENDSTRKVFVTLQRGNTVTFVL